MNDFILYSVIGSVVLTIALNVLPLIFPKAADKLQHKIEDNARHSIEQHEDDKQPRVKVFFPWKAMLIGSLFVTGLFVVVHFLSSTLMHSR